MLIREHEGDPCRWCGAHRPGPGCTCIARPAPAAPCAEPGRRVPACEDNESIGKRLCELAVERQARLSRPAEGENAIPA